MVNIPQALSLMERRAVKSAIMESLNNKSRTAQAIRGKILDGKLSAYDAKMAAIILPMARDDDEPVTKKNHEIGVIETVNAWLQGSQASVARQFIYGHGDQERHTPHRLSRIMEAYDAGEEDQLPPIRFEPQFGSVSDGRHRLTVAYLRGAKTIRADLVFDLSIYLDGHWSGK